jgi:hypothetical protein
MTIIDDKHAATTGIFQFFELVEYVASVTDTKDAANENVRE